MWHGVWASFMGSAVAEQQVSRPPSRQSWPQLCDTHDHCKSVTSREDVTIFDDMHTKVSSPSGISTTLNTKFVLSLAHLSCYYVDAHFDVTSVLVLKFDVATLGLLPTVTSERYIPIRFPTLITHGIAT